MIQRYDGELVSELGPSSDDDGLGDKPFKEKGMRSSYSIEGESSLHFFLLRLESIHSNRNNIPH